MIMIYEGEIRKNIIDYFISICFFFFFASFHKIAALKKKKKKKKERKQLNKTTI